MSGRENICAKKGENNQRIASFLSTEKRKLSLHNKNKVENIKAFEDHCSLVTEVRVCGRMCSLTISSESGVQLYCMYWFYEAKIKIARSKKNVRVNGG